MAVTATGQMVQLNMRVSGGDKRNAEDVLRLMGTSTTELVRKVLAKVASGAKGCAEVLAALEMPIESSVAAESSDTDPVLAQGWSIVDDFCRSIGYESAADVPRDTRTWDEIRDEAMVTHYQEKGWLR